MTRLSNRLARLRAATLAISLLWAVPGVADPLISEVFYDAVGSDDGLGFVELHGAPGTILDGLVLEGINGSNGAIVTEIELFGEILDDGLFVVADVTSEGITAVVGADQLASFDFQNGPDSVVLRSADAVLDAVGYGEFDPGEFFAGEGSPAADGAAGTSLARIFANVDTDDNASDFELLDMPSPGFAELAPIPEPGSALMTAAALCAIGWLRRRGGD